MEWLLILAILACPLMHFWMMRKGGHGHDEHKKEEQKEGGEEKCHIAVGKSRSQDKKK